MKSFFSNKGPFIIDDLFHKNQIFDYQKNKKKNVLNVSNIENSLTGELTFYDSSNFIDYLSITKASFCLIKKKYANRLNPKTIAIFSQDPVLDFINIAKKFYPDSDTDFCTFKQNKKFKLETKKNSFIDERVKIGNKFKIGFNSIIKKNTIIGNNVKIGSNCCISNCILGNNVIINDGTVIGKIGYGFKLINNKIVFVPHFGRVEIEDNVYIGSNCTIDRGSFSNTKIGKSTMIDNLVHIAHNVKIGSNCLLAGQVGIAGSSVIGNNCMIGGQAGISGHLMIGDNVNIGGNSGVLKNVPSNKKVMGYPAVEIKKFIKRNLV